jgi:predicted transcriptional regulator
MKYRSRIDIISVILDAANGRGGGLMKTKIMYQAYLSHDQFKDYLTVLTESGLLNYDVYTRKFKTTEKGLRFLDTYNQMSDVMKTNNNNNYSEVPWKKEDFLLKTSVLGYKRFTLINWERKLCKSGLA